MVIIFWLFLLFSPILWIVAFVLLLIKKRPLIYLLNFVLCGVIIYLLWAGIDPEPAKATDGWIDDLESTAGSILEGMAKGFISLIVAAGWGMSMLIYALLCSTATRPEIDLLLDRNNNSNAAPSSSSSSSSSASSSSQPASSQPATRRSSLIAYFIVGAIVLYLLAKKAHEMGL